MKYKPGYLISSLFSKIFSPIIQVMDEVDKDYEDRTVFRKAIIAAVKLKTPILVSLLVVVMGCACYFYVQSGNTVSAVMSLNYEESAKGLNPNSTRFNAYDFESEEVVRGMLNYSGIDPDEVDLPAVMNSISIRPTNSKGFSEDDFFIATSYRITFRKPSFIKGVSINDLMTFLCKSYKDKFHAGYTENRSILEYDIDEFNDVEFMEIADLLDLKAQQIAKYLNTRVKQSKTFTEKESDETFKSLSQKVEDLQMYDIANYRAFVIQAGLSDNKARYTSALSYVNLMKTISFDKDMAAYDVRNDGIKLYNESMISVVMIPSIDVSKNTYYMSKTKTGMDYMAAQADDYLLTARETAKEISTNKDIIAKMNVGKNTEANIEKAKGMIDSIRAKFSELSKQIEIVDKAYIKYKTKDYLTFRIGSSSMSQRLQPTKVVVIAAALSLGIFYAIWLRFRFFGGGKKK